MILTLFLFSGNSNTHNTFNQAFGHSVADELQSDLIVIENQQFTDNTLMTGGVLTIIGEIKSKSYEPLKLSVSILTESANKEIVRWEILGKDPQGRYLKSGLEGTSPTRSP
jgi:hypothetical protein